MVKLHSDDDRRDDKSRLHGHGNGNGHVRGEGSLYPDYSFYSDAPSLHVHSYAEAGPERWDRDSVTLLETGRDDTNAWAKKFTELNRQVEDIHICRDTSTSTSTFFQLSIVRPILFPRHSAESSFTIMDRRHTNL